MDGVNFIAPNGETFFIPTCIEPYDRDECYEKLLSCAIIENFPNKAYVFEVIKNDLYGQLALSQVELMQKELA